MGFAICDQRQDHIKGDMMRITECREFSRDSDREDFTVVRVCNKSLNALGGRGSWVKIKAHGSRILRRAYGSGSCSQPAHMIELDYDSRRELGIDHNFREGGVVRCELEICRARGFDLFLAHWRNPRIEYRVPYRLAVLSVALGAIGLLLGIIGLMQSLA